MKKLLITLVLVALSMPSSAVNLAEIVADVLNVRDAPGGKVVARLTEGTQVGVILVKNGWVQITYQGKGNAELIKTGWVSEDYLQLIDTDDSAALSMPLGAVNFAEIVADVLNVRNAPDGNVVARLPGGTQVGVIRVKNGWVQITYQRNGNAELIKTGWVSEDYLQLLDTGASSGVYGVTGESCKQKTGGYEQACVSLTRVLYDCDNSYNGRRSSRCAVDIDYQVETDYTGTDYLNVDVGCTAQLKYKAPSDDKWLYDTRNDIGSHSFSFPRTEKGQVSLDFLLAAKQGSSSIRLESAACEVQLVYQY